MITVPSNPTQPHQTRLRSHPLFFRKAIAGPRKETEMEGGGLSSERVFIKENYKGNPFKIFFWLVFNFIREILLQISCLQFYMKNPFNFFLIHLNFSREIPVIFFRKKKSPWNSAPNLQGNPFTNFSKEKSL